MIRFLTRRLLHALGTLFGITLLIFALFHLVGGNPAIRIVGKNATPAELARVSHQMGFDRPLWTQYLDYLGDLVRFDFGRSWETKQRVSEMILDGLWPSLSLAIPAFLISGDTTSERMREAEASGLPLLHKPVTPMALRSMVNQLLR